MVQNSLVFKNDDSDTVWMTFIFSCDLFKVT